MQDAWSVVDTVLSAASTDRTQEVLTFAAADLLLAKIRTQFSQVPEGARLPLRDSVLRHIAKFMPSAVGREGHPAFGRLCLALASLCVRLGNCSEIVKGVVAVLGTQLSALPSLYQVLKHIPEEVCAMAVCASDGRMVGGGC
jgi:hypothetical protein